MDSTRPAFPSSADRVPELMILHTCAGPLRYSSPASRFLTRLLAALPYLRPLFSSPWRLDLLQSLSCELLFMSFRVDLLR